MSAIAKTSRDIRREDQAYITNSRLIGTGIHVSSGGGKGPYSVTVDRLTYKQMRMIARVIRAALNR